MTRATKRAPRRLKVLRRARIAAVKPYAPLQAQFTESDRKSHRGPPVGRTSATLSPMLRHARRRVRRRAAVTAAAHARDAISRSSCVQENFFLILCRYSRMATDSATVCPRVPLHAMFCSRRTLHANHTTPASNPPPPLARWRRHSCGAHRHSTVQVCCVESVAYSAMMWTAQQAARPRPRSSAASWAAVARRCNVCVFSCV